VEPIAHAGDPRSPYWELMKNETIPAESLLAGRMQVMTLATVAQLDPTANWHRIMCEWLYASAPASPLGFAEAQFFQTAVASSRMAA